MPQMAPMSWLTLFIMFSAALMMFSTMNYYSFFNSSPKSYKSMKSYNQTLTWKW